MSPSPKRQQGASTPALGANLLQALELHRFTFLFYCHARRSNPEAPQGDEGVPWGPIHNAREMRRGVSEKFESLFTYRDVLDDIAEASLRAFGPREGARPTKRDAEGKWVPIEGGGPPRWRLSWEADLYLEMTSTEVLNACRALAQNVHSPLALEMVRTASAVAYPTDRPRWYGGHSVRWYYLTELDLAISRVRVGAIELDATSGSRPRASTAASRRKRTGKPSSGTTKGPSVVLGRAGDACIVRGKTKEPLTHAQHAVISELVKAGDDGLSKDALEAIRASARDILKKLIASDADWAAVIVMAGRTNGRYRVRLQP